MKPKRGVAGRSQGGAVGYDTLGYTFAFSIMLCTGAGYLLDRWLGWIPVLTILGTLVGAGLAFAWVYTKVSADEAAAHADEAERKRDKS
jgi:F0F1-type ATP synthase assembly protein I